MVTGLFPDRESAERAYGSLTDRGYGHADSFQETALRTLPPVTNRIDQERKYYRYLNSQFFHEHHQSRLVQMYKTSALTLMTAATDSL